MRNPIKPTFIAPCATVGARYRATRFLSSADALSGLPPDTGREVAFAGRSNAGKSSALNLLTGQRSLARTSKTPGRTQLLNVFEVAPEHYLVDLPGYGYAQVPEATRRHWQMLIGQYLRKRSALRGLLLLVDVRHPLTALDRQLLLFRAESGLAAHILLTKADKLSRGKAMAALHQLQATLRTDFPGISAQLFSSLSGEGADQARAQLDEWLGY